MLAYYYEHVHVYSAIGVLVFSAYLFLHRHVHKSVLPLFLFSVTVAFWQLDIYGLVRSETVEGIYAWRRFPRVATMILAPMMLQFVYSLINKSTKGVLFRLSFLIGSSFALYRFIFYMQETYTKRLFFWTPDITPILVGYFLFTYGLFFIALWLLFQKYRQLQDIVFKKQLLYTFVALFSFVFFNLDILPVVFDGQRIQFVGSLAAVFFFVLTSYAITRHDLFDVRLVITGTSARLIQTILEKLVKCVERDALFKTLAEELSYTLDINVADIVLAKKDRDQTIIHYYSEKAPRIVVDQTGIKQLSQSRGAYDGTSYLPFFSSEALEGYFVLDSENLKHNVRTLTLVQNQMVPLLDRLLPYEKVKSDYESTLKQLDDVKWQLARSEKIVALARTTELCHHELRTPLSVMKLLLGNLPKAPTPEELTEFRVGLETQLNRQEYVVDTHMEICSGKSKPKEVLDLNAVIGDALSVIPISGVTVDMHFESQSLIKGVKGDLISVFSNLLLNSQKAMPEGGTVTIETSEESNKAKVVVTDTGVGIELENLEKIWELYFTTDVTNGQGMGLSLVHTIIQEHDSRITVDSKVGEGTIFTMLFPLVDGE